MQQTIIITGRIVEGTKAASGIDHFIEYGGTIALQRNFFVEAGLELSHIHNGTINVDISPYEFEIKNPEIEVRNVHWHSTDLSIAETFLFVPCMFNHLSHKHQGLVYLPHPTTKIGVFPGFSIIEILAPFVPGLQYGQQIELNLPSNQISIQEKDPV